MPIHPRTPVIVGVGQLNVNGGDAPGPVELLVEATALAAEDSGSDRLLNELDSIRVVRIVTRKYDNAAGLLADLLNLSVGETAVTTDGGQSPQALVNRTALDIFGGDLDAVLIGGAESWKSRMAYKRADQKPPWAGAHYDGGPATCFGSVLEQNHPHETAIGLTRPVEIYPLFENALRAKLGQSVEQHTRAIAHLWSRFSEVAQHNEQAAIRRPWSAADIARVSETNRMVSSPYTKLLCSNSSVNQSAALLMCSVEKAKALGISPDRWVYLHSGTQGSMPAVSNRLQLSDSPAIRFAGQEVLRLAGLDIDSVRHIDLYSCFPSVVQIAAAELNISLDRPLTLTGGLTFAGGPWNNYVTHSIAAMVQQLRATPDDHGLILANGGVMSKVAFGIYSARPPDHPPAVGDIQGLVDAEGTRPLRETPGVPAKVETYTVVHDDVGRPERGYVAGLCDDGERVWGASTDSGVLESLLKEDPIGAEFVTASDGSLVT